MENPIITPQNLEDKLEENISLKVIKDENDKHMVLTKDGFEGPWYKQYKKAFPIDDERETPKKIINILEMAQKNPRNHGYIILSLEMEEKEKRKVVGGAIANRLTCEDYTIATFEYVFVDKKYRGKSLGRLLTEARADEVKKQAESLDSKFVAILSEIENPKKMSINDVKKSDMDIMARRKIFNKLGYKVIDFPYIQLPLRKHSKSVCHLDLLLRVTDEKKEEWKDHIPAKDLKKMLDMYIKTYNENFESYPEYKQMMDYISKREKIPLKNL